jgi:uncharacterized protein
MADASEPQPAPAEVVELRVVGVHAVPSPAEVPLGAVVLEEVGGTRRIRVVIRKAEADYIAMHVQNAPATQPRAHTTQPTSDTFMISLLRALGGRMVEAHITDTDGRTIRAVAVVEGCRGIEILAAPPSDALSLALRVGAPIRIDPAALAALQLPNPGGSPPA